MKIDQLDQKILHMLDLNSRRSFSSIAKHLRISRERLQYRLTRLHERSLIQGYITTINPHLLGYQIFKTYLRLETKHGRKNLFQYLKNHPRLAWLASCDGHWDLVLCLYATDAAEFHEMHVEILSKFSEVVLNFSCYIMTNVKMYHHGYLFKHRKKWVSLCGRQAREQIDEVDRTLMNELTKDSRLPSSELALKCDLGSNAISKRIDRLEQQGIITSYRLQMNLEKLGLLFFKTIFYLRNYDLSLRKKFERYCDLHPNITCYSEQIGDCNLEIEMHVSSYQEYSQVVEDIRMKFGNFIRHYNTLLIREEIYRWLPGIKDGHQHAM